MTAPTDFSRYDGCQATVWALEMILVEKLSPYKAFSEPEQVHKRPNRIPEYLSPGNFITYFIYQSQGLKTYERCHAMTLSSFHSHLGS